MSQPINSYARTKDGRKFLTYEGPMLVLKYTDPLKVLYHLPGSEGYSVSVVGDPDNGAYEWVVLIGGKLKHSNCGYGDADIALRDGLIEMHGLPTEPQNKTGE